MVKLHASLLALTLATSSVLASSDKYQRRDLDVEDLLDARDNFDDLEARQPGLFGAIAHIGEHAAAKAVKVGEHSVAKAAKSKLTGAAVGAAGPGKFAKAIKIGSSAVKIGRKAKVGGAFDKKIGGKVAKSIGRTKLGGKVDSKVRQKVANKAVKELHRTAADQGKQAFNSRVQQSRNKRDQKRANADLRRAQKEIAKADRYLPANRQARIQYRSLENDEDLSLRELDVEELFERSDYDFLDELD